MAMAVEGLPLGDYQKFQASMNDGNDDFDDKDGVDEKVKDWRQYSMMVDSGYCPGSSLTRGICITEFSESRVNPTPLLLEQSDILLEQYLSPGKLQLLTGVDDLKNIESLEIKVDSRETSLGNFGSLLPRLVELKLNGSHIACVRDLGSSLRNLRVLWATRCGLEELDGISAMSNLKELYLEYNEISDVSPLSLLEHLEILDLEGNNIEDITQVQYLSLCPTLRKLALDGNPICVYPTTTQDKPGYDFRETIKNLLPNLLVLDDEKLDNSGSSSVKHNVFDEDWAYLEELQDEAVLQGEILCHHSEDVVTEDRPPTAALRPASAYRPGSALRPSSGFRPLSGPTQPSTGSGASSSHGRPGTSATHRPLSSDTIEGLDSVSELTIGNVICGNPSKALRQRRQGKPGSKEDIDRKLSKLLQKGTVFGGHLDNVDDVPPKEDGPMSSILDELRAWKMEHDERMELIYKSKEAQILVVDHDETEDLEDSSDENDDEDDDDDEQQILANMVENYDIGPAYSRERAKLLHDAAVPEPVSIERSQSDINSVGRMSKNSLREMLCTTAETADFSKAAIDNSDTAESVDIYSSETADLTGERNTDFYSANTADIYSANTADLSRAKKADFSLSDTADLSKDKIADFSRAKSAAFFTAETADFPVVKTDISSAKEADSFTENARYDQSFNVDDENMNTMSVHTETASSFLPLGSHRMSQGDAFRELGSEGYRSVRHRPVSRNQGEPNLAPLRVSSATSPKIINKMEPTPTESPSPRQNKLRVGPTGLPLSSQTQQPVIRNNIAVIQSRSGLVQSCRPGGSQTNIVLLPSQPRIQRHLPEVTSLTPHPPRNV